MTIHLQSNIFVILTLIWFLIHFLIPTVKALTYLLPSSPGPSSLLGERGLRRGYHLS